MQKVIQKNWCYYLILSIQIFYNNFGKNLEFQVIHIL